MIHHSIVAAMLAVHSFTHPIHKRFLALIAIPVYPHP
jgi:hypothetical protein